MDVIKMEPGSDPVGIQTSGIADIEEKKALSEEGNFLYLDVTKIKTERIDNTYEIKSEIVFEKSPVPIEFPMVKTEPEEEFCEMDQVKEAKLEVTAEENEVVTESVAVSHNSGVAEFYENIPEEYDVKKYDCDICGMSFLDSATLKSHYLVHKSHKQFNCGVCGKYFSQSEDLLNHHYRIHSSAKPLTCDDCGKCFTKSSHLKKHSLGHANEKPFGCDVCGKCFTKSSDLKRHSLGHANERPFGCDVCGKSFFQLVHLERHSRWHTGKGLFTCDVCGKKFLQVVYLERHSRLHTGKGLLSCDVCGKRFLELAHLETHSRYHPIKEPVQM